MEKSTIQIHLLIQSYKNEANEEEEEEDDRNSPTNKRMHNINTYE